MYENWITVQKFAGNVTNASQAMTAFFTAGELAVADLLVIAPDSALRCYMDGNTPTASVGLFIEAGKNSYLFGRTLINALKLISTTGANVATTMALLKMPTGG